MIKEMVIGCQRMAVRYVGVKETSVGRIEPCFMGMKGYVLCGVLKKGQSLEDYALDYSEHMRIFKL